MENALGEDLPIGEYRTHNKIKNLKIRVQVRKIKNACFTSRQTDVRDPNELELVNLMKASSKTFEHTFCWQEKVEKVNGENSQNLDEGNKSQKDAVNVCLFSYTDADILSCKFKSERCKTYPTSQLSPLEKKIITLRPKTRLGFSNITWQKPIFSHVREIVRNKSSSQNVALPIGQSMVIMAALFFEDNLLSEEIELCFLQVDDHGMLTVIPDFNKSKPFTFINSRSETFEYEIENISNCLSGADVLHERNFMRKIELHKRKNIENSVGTEFSQPQLQCVSFFINCEFVSAQNFQFSNIFVHYLLVLPKGWNSLNNLEGVTQTCRCKSKDQETITYFGHIFNLDIGAEVTNAESRTVLLKIIMEVTSVDYWGNFRNEGYGFGNIMLIPGIHQESIHTWKLEPSTLKNRLQNYFIGGTPCLEDLTYIIDPHDTEESQVSKYGVKTITSGKIDFRASVIQQKKKKKD
ncbi:Meckel syndrome type 1 protein-like isoform X2 [Stegodyphus dumicola]|uniref:Meckel syndrome type 1 protein-like isoform X2 n=1 Tax=Stegodyphus dumicola TaxID=202533 RepID=UPI0015AB9946|nr:Meckel syndrome type 1 protein-like isoform X2 [Stegodyphus dumicola]